MQEQEKNNQESVDQQLAAIDQKNEAEEAVRKKLLKSIAAMRWKLATEIHQLEDGSMMDFDRWAFQREIYQTESPDLVLMGSTGYGKAQPLTAKVHTPTGWKKMGDIKIGDDVTAHDGTTSKVTGVFPQGNIPVYRVIFADGRSTLACGNHLWEVHNKQWKIKKNRKVIPGTARPRVVSTLEVAKLLRLKARGGDNPITVVLPNPVPKPHRNLPFDPYALGLLLGDGSLAKTCISFTTADYQLAASLDAALPKPLRLKKTKAKYGYNVQQYNGHGWIKNRKVLNGPAENPLRDFLKKCGLWGTDCYNKFIPKEYLEASVEQRWEMIRGLMDTDGSATPSPSYTTCSKQLAEDFVYLVRSVGGISYYTPRITSYTYKGEKKKGAISYRVSIRHPSHKMFFRLKRKQDSVKEDHQYSNRTRLAIRAVEFAGEAECQCITIDHPCHLYITDDFIVTHNSTFAIIDDFAKAISGLRVIHVCDKAQKRNAFVLGIIDPIIHRVPYYAAMLAGAVEDRKAEVDSAFAKHFGDGMMIFIGANSESDFYSYRGDATMVDEHQLCDKDNIAKLFGRRTGSFYRFQTVMGNPTGFGTADNQNIHYQYLLSDQRVWQVPCPLCEEYQKIGWFSHFVEEIRNEYGAIVSVRIRDEEREDQEKLEIRPICIHCGSPMVRLHREGRWKAMNPGKRRTGYQISNIYNPDTNMNELLAEYKKGLHNPTALAKFINDQCGEPYSTSGSNITNEMMEAASTGVSAGVDPYAFHHVNDLDLKDVDIRV